MSEPNSNPKPKPILKKDLPAGEATEQTAQDRTPHPSRSPKGDRKGDGKGKRKGKGDRDQGAAPAKTNPALMRGPRPVVPKVVEETPTEEAPVAEETPETEMDAPETTEETPEEIVAEAATE
jgi:hypothetical protein